MLEHIIYKPIKLNIKYSSFIILITVGVYKIKKNTIKGEKYI